MFGSTFFLTRRAAPLGDADFLLVFTRVSLQIRLCPTGGQQQARFPSEATLGVLLHLPMVFDDFRLTVFVYFLFDTQEMQKMHGFPLFLKDSRHLLYFDTNLVQ